ncbi:hypothetical protein [Microcoleus sp.]|uniref:hypothetical protein n=1 Tax=Microcoleus sp. TaxID=44472 RepID=UPI00359475DE
MSIGSKKVSVVGEAKAYDMVLTTIVAVGAIAPHVTKSAIALSTSFGGGVEF